MNIGIKAFAELGVADRLIDAPEEGWTADDIAIKDNWNADLIYRLLRVCEDAGLVTRVGTDNDRFRLTTTGKLLVTNDSSEARSFIRLLQGRALEEPTDHLANLISQKTTFEDIQKKLTSGLSLYEWFTSDDQKDILALENASHIAISNFVGSSLVNGINFARFCSIVDCGGNHGAFLAQILKRYPTVKHGIVFDLPATIQRATNSSFENLHIETDRYEFVSGDLFNVETIPSNGDAYILQNILDAMDDEKVVKILTGIRQAVCLARRQQETPVAVFLIGMHILPETDPASKFCNWQTHALDLLECVWTGGRERTVKQFQKLIEAAGLEYITYYPIGQPESVIEAMITPVKDVHEKMEANKK